MEIKTHVYFNVKYAEPKNYGQGQSINNIDDLKNYIYCQRLGDKVLYTLKIIRTVQVVADNNYPGQTMPTDTFTFVVADRLMYLDDLIAYVKKNATGKECQDVNFKNFAQYRYDNPIFFTGKYEYNGSFLPDAPVAKRPLSCRPITAKDIVVDKNLNQIWPVKTGKPPVGLVELLNKKTENVH